MSKGVYNYYDPEYDPALTEGDVLLMSVNEASFSFVIMQTETKKILVWGENFPESELIHPAELSDILTAKYDSVKALVQSNSFTVVPKDLYNEADIAEYSRFLSAKANDTILINELDSDNIVVFKISDDAVKNISGFVDLDSVFFGGKVLAAVNREKADDKALYVHVEESKIHILCFKAGAIRFYNVYDFANADELMYYVVLVSNDLELNLDETSIVLSGDINLTDEKISRLNELLPKVTLNTTKILELPEGFVPHQVLSLSGLTLCESLVVN